MSASRFMSRASMRRKFPLIAGIPALLALTGCNTMQVAQGDVPGGYRVLSLHQSAATLTDGIPQDKLTNASRQLAKEGIKALDAKEYEKASALFNLALKTDINNSYLHYLNGLTYHIRGLNGEGSLYKVGQTPALPGVEIAAEDYRRLARLAKTGPVSLEIRSNVHFEDADTKAYNSFGEIPGADPAAGYVMAGAHLDSWVAADGATDNGAGSVVVLEAARILKALGVKPKRTIRFALWSGEEQGLLGSAAYVEQHLAKRPPDPDPARQAAGPMVTHSTFPVTPLPGYRQLAGYFNLDNGSGKVRGVYVEGNMAAAPILREWLGPYASLGATTVSAAPTGGTDHVLMARIGLPAYQFIQDPLDYDTTTHHSSVDTYDHLRTDDLKQAAAVMAWVLLQAAEAKDPLPAGIVPTQPEAADPFAYRNPREE